MTNVSMREIENDDIQLIRYWRNLDHVRSRMVMQNYIERDGQRRWFENLTRNTSFYFIYGLGSRDIGCVNCTKIDRGKKSFEGGIFCGDTEYLNHWVNILACLKMYDFAFDELGLEVSYATILLDNPTALNLNTQLGYSMVDSEENNIGRFVLHKNDYKEKTQGLRKFFARETAAGPTWRD